MTCVIFFVAHFGIFTNATIHSAKREKKSKSLKCDLHSVKM